MARHIDGYRGALLAGAGLVLGIAGAASGGVDRPGSVFNGDLEKDGLQWTYDTGASITLLSREAAQCIGLLADDDNDGIPDAADAQASANNGSVQLWCFDDVGVQVEDSQNDLCTDFTTVYVSKNDDFWAGQNLLGRDIRRRFRGQWDDFTEEVNWRVENPFLADLFRGKAFKPKTDSKNGKVRKVADVQLVNLGNETTLEMSFSNISQLSFVPESVAMQLELEPLELIDLPATDPELYERLLLEDLLLDGQPVFPVAQIELVDLGLAGASPITVLIVNDDNMEFGILGREAIQQAGGTAGGPLLYRETDLASDDFLVVDRKSGDINGDGLIDVNDLNILLANWGLPC